LKLALWKSSVGKAAADVRRVPKRMKQAREQARVHAAVNLKPSFSRLKYRAL